MAGWCSGNIPVSFSGASGSNPDPAPIKRNKPAGNRLVSYKGLSEDHHENCYDNETGESHLVAPPFLGIWSCPPDAEGGPLNLLNFRSCVSSRPCPLSDPAAAGAGAAPCGSSAGSRW